MKIKEIFLQRYGPLRFKKPLFLREFNLIFGRNEEGKTLTLEGLIKLLIKKRKITQLKEIERVKERPEGYVILEDKNKKEWKLPEQGDLTEITHLKTFDCWNIFIIRNSELLIPKEFFTDVTSHLIGLKREEISKVKEAILNLGKITSQGDFQNKKEEKLKERIERGEKLLFKIKKFLERIKEEKLEELEKTLFLKEKEIESLKSKLEKLQKARKRKEYERGKEILGSLERLEKRMRELEFYDEEKGERWKSYEREIKEEEGEIKEILKEIEEKEREEKEILEEIKKEEKEYQELEKKNKILEEKINERELDLAKELKIEILTKKKVYQFFDTLLIISAIFSFLSLIFLFFRKQFLVYGFFIFFLSLVFLFAFLKLQSEKKKAKLNEILFKNKLLLSGVGIEINELEDIIRIKNELKQKNEVKRIQLEERRRDWEGINRVRNEKIKQKQKIEEKIKKRKSEIEETKMESQVKDLKEYLERVREKKEIEREIGKEKAILKDRFGKDWEEEIENLKVYAHQAKDIEYFPEDEERIQNKIKKEEGELKKINEDLRSLREKMEEIARESSEVLREIVSLKSVLDLEQIGKRIRDFINEHKSKRENALIAKEIFEEIEREEKEKISRLFSKESLISRYFEKITQGFYTQVIFDSKNEKIEVVRKNGKRLAPHQLSGGTYDQLYFCIRLKLGELLLSDKKGFLLVDDPFIKADIERCRRQIEILKSFAFEFGWQIIFLSAKEEIRELLKDDINSNTIQYIEISEISTI